MDTAEYFKSLSRECQALKNRVRHFIDDEHWPTDGEWKESVLRTMITRSCPKNISVGRGFIITDDGPSSQIDVLLYDNTQPVLYRDGDLVFITPSACRGVIEVKSTYTAEQYREATRAVAEVAALVRNSTGDPRGPRMRHYYPGIFVGVFFYTMDVRNPSIALSALKELTDESRAKTINHVCLGKDMFIKFWNRPQNRPCPNDGYHGEWQKYNLEDQAVGYFLHNLMSTLSHNSITQHEKIWFPLTGKDPYFTGSLRR